MEKFSELLLALYQAARERSMTEFQDVALKLIKPALGFDSATWATGQLTPHGIEFFSAHLHDELPGRLENYEAVKKYDPVVNVVTQNLGITLNYHMPSLPSCPTTGPWRDYANCYQHQNGLVTAQALPQSSLLYWIGLYRAEEDRQFSEAERLLGQALVPHLQQALATNWSFHIRTNPADASTTIPAAIVDNRGMLYHVEPGFGRLLQAEWPDCDGRQLPASVRQHMQDPLHGRYLGKQIVLIPSQFKDLQILRARKRLPIDDLSGRELSIARYIAAGNTYKEIARLLSISPATTRNHIQRIHNRLKVRNNAELITQLKLIDFEPLPCTLLRSNASAPGEKQDHDHTFADRELT